MPILKFPAHRDPTTKIFFRPNLIFWFLMGCGKARFGQKGQKPSQIENFGLKVCSLGPESGPYIRARGNPQWDLVANRTDLEASHTWDLKATHTWDLKATRDETSKQPTRTLRQPAMISAGCLEVLPRVAPRSQGENFKTKIVNFRCFLALPTETTHPINVQNMRFGR